MKKCEADGGTVAKLRRAMSKPAPQQRIAWAKLTRWVEREMERRG